MLTMRNVTRLAVFLAVALATQPAVAQQLEDVVYLNDGSVLRGVITEQIPGQSVLIRTRDGNVFRITIDRISRMAREQRPQLQTAGVKQKSAGAAFLLSFLIPGAGQAYNGQYGKGGAQFVVSALGAAVSIGTWADCWEDDVDCAEWSVGTALWLGSWIWSMIDAPVSANAINNRSLALEIGPRVTVARATAPITPAPGFRAIRRGPRVNLAFARISF